MMGLQYEVPDYKKVRVIIDTDAACEADDPFAIAHALLCRKFEVKAILAEHFGTPESTRLSYNEIITVLEAMELEVPVFMGEEGKLSDAEGKEIFDERYAYAKGYEGELIAVANEKNKWGFINKTCIWALLKVNYPPF